METNDLYLCRDIVLVANGCTETILQQFTIESILERK